MTTRTFLAGAALALCLPLLTSAATLAELQAQLAQLMAQLSALQQGSAQAQTTTSQSTQATTQTSASAQCLNLSRNLSRGMQGSDVTSLQTFLIAQGHLAAGNNTGFYGALTEAAVKQFQCKHLRICSGSASSNGYGAVGPKTRTAIAKTCSTSSTSQGTSISGITSNYAQRGYGTATNYAQGGYTTTEYAQATYYSQGSYSGVSTTTATSSPATPISQDPNVYVSPQGSDTGAGTLVSPYRTITRAQQRVRELKAAGVTSAITVHLRGGTYNISSPLVFGSDDGGSASQNITYRSYQSERAVISGGVPISNWSGSGIVTAPAQSFTRQLYASSGVRPERARFPSPGTYFTLKGVATTSSCAITSFELETPFALTAAQVDALNGSEMVVLKTFQQSRILVSWASITGAQEITVYPESGFGSAEGCDGDVLSGNDFRFRAYFENKSSFLTREGEWVYSAGNIMYKLRAGESTNGFSVPRLENLVTISGSASRPVRNLTFTGIEFRDTGWAVTQPSALIGKQAGFTSFAFVGAVEIGNAENVTISQSKFRNMGATALVVNPNSHGVSIVRNDFEDISGNGVSINTLNVVNANDATTNVRNLSIEDNLFQGIGLDYAGVGIFGGYLPSGSIGHNTMRYLSYSGISLGWFTLPQSLPAISTVIGANEISRALLLFNDGGAIYSPGWGDKGLLIRDNYLHNSKSTVPSGFSHTLSAGIYLDGYASEVIVSNNLLQNMSEGLYLQTQSTPIDARAKRNTIVNLGMVAVTTPIYEREKVLAEAAKPEVANTIQYDLNDRPSIRASAGMTASAKALWGPELSRTAPYMANMPVAATPLPSCAVTASPTSLTVGSNVTLTWSSTNATHVIEPTGVQLAANGTNVYTVTNTGSNVYTFVAHGAGGQAQCSVTVTATVSTTPAPTCSVSANPTTLSAGSNVTLTWSSTNATHVIEPTGVQLSANGVNVYTVPTVGSHTYTFTAHGAGGQGQCSVPVTAY